MLDYALMLMDINYARYYAGIMHASLDSIRVKASVQQQVGQ